MQQASCREDEGSAPSSPGNCCSFTKLLSSVAPSQSYLLSCIATDTLLLGIGLKSLSFENRHLILYFSGLVQRGALPGARSAQSHDGKDAPRLCPGEGHPGMSGAERETHHVQ